MGRRTLPKMAQDNNSMQTESENESHTSMKTIMPPKEKIEAMPTAMLDDGSAQEPIQQDNSNNQTPDQENNQRFPLLSLAGELRNKIYEHDVAAVHSTIHLVRGIGAFRQSPLASLNKQIRREYLSIVDDNRSRVEAVVRNLDFSHVIGFLKTLPELSTPEPEENCAKKSTVSPIQTAGSNLGPKRVQDTAVASPDSATKTTPAPGKAATSETRPRTIVLKLVFSKLSPRKARGPALLTLLPHPRSAQHKRWHDRLTEWKSFLNSEPKVDRFNFEYQAKTRMPFQMVGLKIFGFQWPGRANGEFEKLAAALEHALGRDTSKFYQVAPMIEASDEEDQSEEDGDSKWTPIGAGGPRSWR